ncbi:kinase-like domain-containing protein [Stachybotrys elegans]|uniref:non-specific serine/threonine protein kinase n=1 Tax=Stachybotrys elegans TaxID=80388 RepID=A0A8K0SYQ9_9HYPO|nr:kinase-like domain-containing protein [Stachybotrys elegans]
MSLIPYNPREGREIVLRHRNAIVVRDSASQRLEIRGLPECPTCHQPLQRSSHATDRSYDRSFEMDHDSYVDPDYFRMLRAGNQVQDSEYAPSSPIRRMFQPALASTSRVASPSSVSSPMIDDEADFLSSSPGVAQAEGSRIRKEAFSPNYFNTFFVEEKVLGKGGKGVVLLVRHEIDGCHLGHFACKRVPVGDDHAWLEKVLIEVELLAKLSHPNLVSYRHVWLEDVRLTRFGPSVACAFILQQYCNGGDLHQYVVGNSPGEMTKEELKARMRRRSKSRAESPREALTTKTLSFDMIYSLFKDITSGVAYLHAANYIHRDLKPNNCLLHQEGNTLTCLISDFGEVQAENVVRKSTGSTGTISYCAPEVLKVDATGRYGNFTTKSDIFSLGMILYFMCFGRLPYRSANALHEELEDIDELRAEITGWQGFQDERRERPDLPSRLYQLLKKLLALEPAQRPSAAEVLNAMRSESNLDGMAKERASSPPVEIRGGRVQNLDSPATPGTPISDPHKSSRGRHQTLEEIPWSRSPTRREEESPSALRKRRLSSNHATAMAITRSRDGFDRHTLVHEAIDSAEDELTTPQPFSPPLLMAPPRTGIAALRHRIMVSVLDITRALGLEQSQLGYLARFSLFLIKLATLGRSCWPYMSHLNVSIPLMMVASLDLGLPATRTTTVLPHQGQLNRGFSRFWGFGTSLLLLALHVGILWLANHWGTLCISLSPSDDWKAWDLPPLPP